MSKARSILYHIILIHFLLGLTKVDAHARKGAASRWKRSSRQLAVGDRGGSGKGFPKGPSTISPISPSPITSVPTLLPSPFPTINPTKQPTTSETMVPTSMNPTTNKFSPTSSPIDATQSPETAIPTTSSPSNSVTPATAQMTSRSLAPFDIILEGAEDQFVQDTMTIKLTVQEFLYSKLSDIWSNLQMILVQEESSDRRRLLKQVFSFSGDAEFVRIDANSIVYEVPTTEQLQDEQRKALTSFIFEMQNALSDNGITVTLDDITFSDGATSDKGDTAVGTLDDQEDEDGNAGITATWATLLSGVVLFSVGCFVYRRGRSRLEQYEQQFPSKKYVVQENEEYSDIVVPESEEEDDTSSMGAPSMTWANIFQQQQSILQSAEADDYIGPQTEFMNIPKLEQNEVVELRNPNDSSFEHNSDANAEENIMFC